MNQPSEFAAHPLRERISQEFHARPSLPLTGPTHVAHLAFLHGPDAAAEEAHLAALFETRPGRVVDRSEAHLLFDAGAFRLRRERHTEFSTWSIYAPLVLPATDAADASPLAPPVPPAPLAALDAATRAWLAATPGQLIVATHISVYPAESCPPDTVATQRTPDGTQITGAQVAGGAAWAITDFLLHEGFSHLLLLDVALTPRQAGRTVQRLLDIETYRMLAMLGLPVAKEVGPWLGCAEGALAELMDRIGAAQDSGDERRALAELTALAAEVEHAIARSTFRFGASAAYQHLVMQRISELREIRAPGLPTFHEFMQRRLQPAMSTCAAMARRQEELSARVARNSQLLRTRVDIELEGQNQQLLRQMNQRARLQLRLQETVEGLSVIAITYYGSQLVQYLAKGLHGLLPGLVPEIATALAIPLIAILALAGLRRLRRTLANEESSA